MLIRITDEVGDLVVSQIDDRFLSTGCALRRCFIRQVATVRAEPATSDVTAQGRLAPLFALFIRR